MNGSNRFEPWEKLSEEIADHIEEAVRLQEQCRANAARAASDGDVTAYIAWEEQLEFWKDFERVCHYILAHPMIIG